jgi:hypothetical protein
MYLYLYLYAGATTQSMAKLLLLPRKKQRVLLTQCLKISPPNKRLEIYRNNSICLVSRAYSLDNQPRNSVKRLPQEGLDAALFEGLGA